jgi:ArsR family transcriptional regulator, zinc-responsive transcriptional repressor
VVSDGGQAGPDASTGSDVADDYARVTDLFAALASPVRAAVVHRLIDRTHTVADLVEALHLSQPLVSHHLARLRYAGLVVGERAGRHVEYRVADEHVAHIFLDAYQHSTEVAHDPGT